MPLCFKDITFCKAYNDTCVNKKCFRAFTRKQYLAARKWWHHDPDNAPIAFADMSNGCEAFIKFEEYMKKEKVRD